MFKSDAGIPPKYLKPFHKLFCKQLLQGQFKDGLWTVKLGDEGDLLNVDMVWLQGRIIGLNDKKLKITDVDDTPLTIHYDQVQKDLSVGCYVQVLGQVVTDEGSGHIRVMATKICNLSDNSVAEQMWQLEVEELHNLITKRISFNI